MKTLRVALAQMNPTVGDIEGNARAIIGHIKRARTLGADLVAFPELAVTGYPPEDLLLKPRFIEDNLAALDRIRAASKGIACVIGFVDRKDDIYNAAALVADTRLVDVYHKTYLPNYGVFDEYRYFGQGARCPLYALGGVLLGVNICEDIWYPEGPARRQALAGAEVIVNINASPYTLGKSLVRERMIATRASDSGVIVAYLNAVGGQDELVFDGGSFIMSERGELLARAPCFDEHLLVADLDVQAVFQHRLREPKGRRHARALASGDAPAAIDLGVKRKARKKPAPKAEPAPALGAEEEAYGALVVGVRDYVRKNRFRGALIGISGGVDSAFVAAVAVDALGGENVRTIYMPSRYSSEQSGEDAAALARNLGVRHAVIPIDPVFDAYLATLKAPFKGRKPDTAEENLQARIRGNILMAHSNKFGCLVLTTGNKSEMSMGYATLYGDMAGGFAVVKDVPKTLLYRLGAWRNGLAGYGLIPDRILTRAPSAELRPGQLDTDSLPPYGLLDPILEAYIEDDLSLEEIAAFTPCDPETARRVIAGVDLNEYKRRQSPPGIKITSRAFGRDRRFPITNRYRPV